jgi:hypothetical protein
MRELIDILIIIKNNQKKQIKKSKKDDITRRHIEQFIKI